MDLKTIVEIATLLSIVIAALGLFVGIHIYNRQMTTQVFLQYTKRYEDIMESFPKEARKARLDLTGDPPPASEKLTISILRYLNLCSEEYYLYKRGYLNKEIWNIWEEELQRTLKSRLLIREWRDLKSEFESYPDFCNYVEGMQPPQTEK